MVYDLVLVTYDDKIFILLKHPDLFEKLTGYIKPCLVENTQLRITMSEYQFILETIGDHIMFANSKMNLVKDFRGILEYKKISDSYSGKLNIDREFKLCPIENSVTYLMYHSILKKSFLSKWGKQLCQFYGDCQFIDSIDMKFETEAERFFHEKYWNDKHNLLKKLVAFKNLFE